MGINTTGVADTKEYLIGRGKTYFAELNTDGTPKSYKQVGNVPDFNVTVDSELYEHFSSLEGLRVKDLTVVIEQTMDMAFILENVKDFGNLKYFFSGEASTYTNPAVAGVTGAVVAQDGTLVANSYYSLVDTTGAPLFAIDVSNLTVETTNATPVALTEGTDYDLYADTGMIFLKNTAIVTTAISGDEGLTIDYTADASAGAVTRLQAQTKASVTIAVRFESIDANDDTKQIYDFHKVTISADGDYSLISDEVTQAPMAGSVEKSSKYSGTLDIYDMDERTA
jgi:hypothetical protein